jgi:isoprenylcysteine carboxyl methyltransferase (ICMT) family protein YpbQ
VSACATDNKNHDTVHLAFRFGVHFSKDFAVFHGLWFISFVVRSLSGNRIVDFKSFLIYFPKMKVGL